MDGVIDAAGWALAVAVLLALAAPRVKDLRRHLYMRRLPHSVNTEWRNLHPRQDGFIQDIACVDCPKFSRLPLPRCTVPFGSPLRKCITASVEYHLRDVRGLTVLEIGCGTSSHAKQVVEISGGSWIGLDPFPGKPGKPSIRTVGGVVQKLPFRDECFDVICGVQTLEHWEDLRYRFSGMGYENVLNEVWRVLKPGGWIYLDAPIHLHGAPEFIRGDLKAVTGIFRHRDWCNLRVLSWRRLHQPLRPRLPPAGDRKHWPEYMPDSTDAERAELARRSTWIIAFRAEKPASDPSRETADPL